MTDIDVCLFAVCFNNSTTTTSLNAFDDSMKEWETQWPQFAKWGWGPSVQAEKWNGRHAMFGWVFICACAYAKGHGLIPDADVPLDLKEWGTLATISGKSTITNERAIILIANVHFLFLGVCATLCPLPFGDKLLEFNKDQEPFGYFPEFNTGLTEEAEILNGRMAMLGLVVLSFATAIEQKSMIDIINEWLGGAYY